MEVDLFVNRIKAMKEAGLKFGKTTSVDTPFLPEESRKKLENSGFDFEYKTYFGFDDKTGELLPKVYLNRQDFDYERYCNMCAEKYKKNCWCKTVIYYGLARHLIAPDGSIYNCTHLLYIQKHPVGHIDNGWPKNLLEPIRCTEYGHCDPCDIWDMEVHQID